MNRCELWPLMNRLLFRWLRPKELPRRGVGSLRPVRMVLGLPRRRDIFTSWWISGSSDSISCFGVLFNGWRIRLGLRRTANIDWLLVRRREEVPQFCCFHKLENGKIKKFLRKTDIRYMNLANIKKWELTKDNSNLIFSIWKIKTVKWNQLTSNEDIWLVC